MNLELLLLGLV